MKKTPIVILVTTANAEEAEKIARQLLNEELIACANLIGPASSIFKWKGKVEKVEEHLLLMKSRLDLFEELSEKIKALHSYEIPEIIALPTIKGLDAYLKWLNNSLK